MAKASHSPALTVLTAEAKIARIRSIGRRQDLTLIQKYIALWIVIEATRDGVAEISTADLMSAASLKRRDTVFAATKVLRSQGIIDRASGSGQSGRFTVLPERVVAAVTEAYVAATSGTVTPDRFEVSSTVARDQSDEATSPVQPYRLGVERYGESGPLSGDEAVASNRTALSMPVRSHETGPIEAVRSDETGTVEAVRSNELPRARIETPLGLLSTKLVSEESPPPPSEPKTNVQPIPNWNTAFADDHYGEDIVFRDGRVSLLNGSLSYWLERFGNDVERLELALIEAAGGVQPASRQPVKLQVERQLARFARDKLDKDQRYERAAKSKKADGSNTPRAARRNPIMDMASRIARGDPEHLDAEPVRNIIDTTWSRRQ